MSKNSWQPAWRRHLLTISVALAACAAMPTVAHAQDKPASDCPPGSWFCGETQAPATGANKDLEALPAAKEQPPAAPTSPPAHVVVVPAPAPSATVVVAARPAPPPYYYVPRTPPKKSEWGINMHLGGLMIGTGRNGDAGMALFGVGVRYRPVPAFALEADIDAAGGTDYNGMARSEVGYSLNGLLFLNPKNKAQFYFVGGLGLARARAAYRGNPASFGARSSLDYSYLGVQAGAGLELRLSKVVALNGELRGIYRGRIDSHRDEYPEFVSPDGRTTNKSGAGIFQVGMTLYW